MRYRDGIVLLEQDDVTVSMGGLFGYRRVYSNRLTSPYDGGNGYNWWVSTLPYVTPVSASVVQVVFEGNQTYEFTKSGTTYTPQYSWLQVSLTENTGTNTFTFTNSFGGETKVTVFNNLLVTGNAGGFLSHTDARGIQTTITSSTGAQINELQRSYTLGGITTIDSLLFAYVTSGLATGSLQSVTYRRQVGGGSWDPVAQTTYAYYGSSDSHGSTNDLQSATHQQPDGSGGWQTIGVDYYRYYLSGDADGFAHALKMHFGPEAYRLLFNASINLSTASDTTVQPYADQYFEYDPTTGQATKEVSQVCESCVGGGSSTDLFVYTPNPSSPSPGFNVWSGKTVQTLPDGSTVVVYTNYAALPMLRVNIDSTGANRWATFYRYDGNGQVIWLASPSAVALPPSLSTLEAYDDLLNYIGGTNPYQYLNNSTGLIEVTDYYSSSGSGAAQYYIQNKKVRQGQSGSDVFLQSFTYTSNTDSAGNTIYLPATQVSYPDATTTSITITTSYAYTWQSGTNILQQKTTTLPAVASGQNGDGTTPTIVENYDAYGNLTSDTDERGIIDNYTYVGLGQVSQQVLNYQSGVTQPGVNVTSDFIYDNQGRPTRELGPSHTVVLSGTATTVRRATYYVYKASVQPTSGTWDEDQDWTGNGYATGSGPSYTYSLVDPVSIAKKDKNGRMTDQIASKRSSGSGALSPSDTFVQTDWQSWSSTQYDNQGRTLSQRTYFLIPSSGDGTVGTNYGQTDFGYDALERRNRAVAPGGTITRTVWTAMQWVDSVWMGTDDTGATDSNPAGSGSPNNMVIVTANQYDGGSDGGDGNLTQVTQYVSATSGDTRVTSYGYDFRDRRINMDGEVDVYEEYTYDNLDRLTQTDRKNTTSSGNLIGRNQTKYDDRGRVYEQLTYAVDSSTGTVGNALTTNNWYDFSGNLIQQINGGDGQAFTKTSYNGVNWVTATYSGYNTSGTSYGQATDVTNDNIAEQTLNTYDEAGNLISLASFERLNDAPSTGTGSTGALSYGTQPKARVSYAAIWYDGVDRPTYQANIGVAASFTRPSTPSGLGSGPIISSTTYDNAGRVFQVADSYGIITQNSYDNANRTTQIIEDYGTGSLNRTTNWTYTLDNLAATLTAVNSVTGDQTTTYTYGTTLTASSVARNDLLVSIAYPDSVSGSDVVSYAYNRLGQQRTITDQRGTIRTLYYDKLGRLTNDCVTTNGSGTDVAVKQIATVYEVRGMAQTITSTDSATQGGGTVLNQVQLTYNSFAQLTKEQQSHSGSVGGTTPSVQYAYDSGVSSSNEIRLNQLTYPNGRTIAYNFGTSGGMNDYLNRVGTIQDTTSGTTNLASYTYLGLGTVIRITYPQPSVWLDLWGGTSGTFSGLDAFNRIIDQRWQNNITGTPADIDRYGYDYDLDSNRQYKQNVVGTLVFSGGLDEYYTYDNINRLTEMFRGTLNSTKTGILVSGASPNHQQGWGLDETGNWAAFSDDPIPGTRLVQDRTSNKVNEITAFTTVHGPVWATPAYDAAGNMTTMPQVSTPTSSFTAVYDAWNRMVSISDTGGTVATYQYDGRNRRIVKQTIAISETRHFYWTDDWQDVEERTGSSTSMDRHYVWGIRYVDELVCRDTAASPTRLYAMQDANFNLTSICDASGNVQERYYYDPYGYRSVMNGTWSGISSSAFGWLVGYQGLFIDAESSIVYNRKRTVQPVLGSFGQRDPLQYEYTMNFYERALSNPIVWVDPFGLAAASPSNSGPGVIPPIIITWPSKPAAPTAPPRRHHPVRTRTGTGTRTGRPKCPPGRRQCEAECWLAYELEIGECYYIFWPDKSSYALCAQDAYWHRSRCIRECRSKKW